MTTFEQRAAIVQQAADLVIAQGYDAARVRRFVGNDAGLNLTYIMLDMHGEQTPEQVATFIIDGMVNPDGGAGQADYVPMGSLYNIHPKGR